MKKNKILALLLVVAVIVATMGGCAQEPVESSSTGGSSATTSSESSSTGDSSDKVKLEFFYQKSDTPQIVAIVDAFNASQDKIDRRSYGPFAALGHSGGVPAGLLGKPDRGFDR